MSEPVRGWILWWRYGDGSSCAPVRAYNDEARAKVDFELVSYGESMREWHLTEVPLYGRYD